MHHDKALFKAVWDNDEETLVQYLERGRDPNQRMPDEGSTGVLREGGVSIIRFIASGVAIGGVVAAPKTKGAGLMVAAPGIFLYKLLEEKAIHFDQSGWTPMHVAAFCGHIPMISRLHEYGGSLDQKDEHGRKPEDVAMGNLVDKTLGGILKKVGIQEKIYEDTVQRLKDLSNKKVHFFPFNEIKSYIKLDNYLGGGAYGKVYRGRWQGDEVALKVMVGHLEEKNIQEFHKEAKLMTALSHPNIVRVYGACLDRHPALAMELMDGNLQKLLEEKELVWSRRIEISLQITQGLIYLHQKGIVHRDIKSFNIMLDKQGNARLGDLGLSERIKNTLGTCGSLGTAAFGKREAKAGAAGTLLWMAPELLVITSPLPEFTKACDVYSLGMVFLEIASRRIPWADIIDKIQLAVFTTHLKSGILPFPDQPKDCPDKYYKLMCSCCAFNPIDRPKLQDVQKTLMEIKAELAKKPSIVRYHESRQYRLQEERLPQQQMPAQLSPSIALEQKKLDSEQDRIHAEQPKKSHQSPQESAQSHASNSDDWRCRIS